MSKLNEEELIKLIEEALEIKSGSVNIESSSEDFEEWDSLGHLNILVSYCKTMVLSKNVYCFVQ